MLYFRSQVVMLPEQKLGVVVLSNDGGMGEVVLNISRRALTLLLQARRGVRQIPYEPDFAPAAQAWTQDQWQSGKTAYTGDYVTVLGFLSIKPEGSGLSAQLDGHQLEVREGEAGRLGLRYRLPDIAEGNLGLFSEAGFEYTQVDNRHVLFAVIKGKRRLFGERLAEQSSLPPNISRWIGRYNPRLLEGECTAFDFDEGLEVLQANGRLCVELRIHPALGGQQFRLVLQPVSETVLRAIGPLSDTGPVMQWIEEKDEAPSFCFLGWGFDRVA
jgi:hypothetical protein